MALAAASPYAAGGTTVAFDAHDGHPHWEDELSQGGGGVDKDQESGRVPTRSSRRDDRAVAVGSTVGPLR